VAESNCPPLA